MKNFKASLAAVCLAVTFSFSGIALADLPTSIDQFSSQMKTEAKTPEGAAKMWFESVFMYNKSRALGAEALKQSMYKLPADWESNSFYVTLIERMKTMPHIFRSFCSGSSPDNGYKADIGNCKLTVTRKDEIEPGVVKIFLKSSGSDSNKPLKLKKDKDGLYKVSGFGSIILKVRAPEAD